MAAIALQPAFSANLPTQLRSRRRYKDVALTHPNRTTASTTEDLGPLLGRVAGGDRDAFAQLYDAISPAIFGTVLSIIRSREHAEDVTQDVFLEIWRKADAWDKRLGSATTWMLMMARRRTIDRIRREEALQQRQDRVGPTWHETPTSVVEDSVLERETTGEARASLSELSQVQREVIELAYYGDYTYVEVAEMLGLPLGTVKTRMRDGLMRIRRSLGVVQ